MGSESLELSKRPVDLLIGAFFLLHLPIMLFIDAQIIIPRHFFPTIARELVDWHIKNSGDFLMAEPPLYFRSFVWTEFVIQLPLHVANAYAFLCGKKWGRITGIIYGVHVATTMRIFWVGICNTVNALALRAVLISCLPLFLVGHAPVLLSYEIPILADILTSDNPNRNTLLGIYVPYLLIPLLIVARVLPSSDPFQRPSPAVPVVSSSDRKKKT